MFKLWGPAFLIFASLVLLVFVFNAAAQTVDSMALPSVGTGTARGGLSTVDFAQFVKGGKGWAYITQGYGTTPYSYLYIGHWHNGIDIAADYGVPILSADDGTVVATGDQDDYCPGRAFGKFVVVKDPAKDVDVMYAHLSAIKVSPGEKVSRDGTVIGLVGETGLETGPHLHLSVFRDDGFTVAPAYGCGLYPQGHDIDPIPYLEGE